MKCPTRTTRVLENYTDIPPPPPLQTHITYLSHGFVHAATERQCLSTRVTNIITSHLIMHHCSDITMLLSAQAALHMGVGLPY